MYTQKQTAEQADRQSASHLATAEGDIYELST